MRLPRKGRAKRRSNGDGMLRKRGDGRWEQRLSCGYQPNGKPKFKYFYGKTQKEVKEKVKAFQKEQEEGLVTEDVTFETWANTWFEGYKARLEKSTQDGYRYTLRKLVDHFGHMKLRTIKTMHVEQFLQQIEYSVLTLPSARSFPATLSEKTCHSVGQPCHP